MEEEELERRKRRQPLGTSIDWEEEEEELVLEMVVATWLRSFKGFRGLCFFLRSIFRSAGAGDHLFCNFEVEVDDEDDDSGGGGGRFIV